MQINFEFYVTGEYIGDERTITYMDCSVVEEGVYIGALPFFLTVSEERGRVIGSLILEVWGDVFSRWIEEENEDDYFYIAEGLVRDWLEKGTFPTE